MPTLGSSQRQASAPALRLRLSPTVRSFLHESYPCPPCVFPLDDVFVHIGQEIDLFMSSILFPSLVIVIEQLQHGS